MNREALLKAMKASFKDWGWEYSYGGKKLYGYWKEHRLYSFSIDTNYQGLPSIYLLKGLDILHGIEVEHRDFIFKGCRLLLIKQARKCDQQEARLFLRSFL